jgi:Zn-finger nucleic acid-binding protein
MEPEKFEDITVEKCTGCEGLWFDSMEHEQLKKLRGSETIDTGDPKDGAEFNHIDDYSCPRCGGKMVKMVDSEQPHIWYERCHSCFGAYFDAGEFRDYKHRSIVDFVADMFVRERK